MRKRLVIALGDAGSANYILPILSTLNEQFSVWLVVDFNGGAKNVLDKSPDAFQHSFWDGSAGFDFEGQDFVICGTAGKAQGLWKAATVAAKEARIPLIWLGDFFNSGAEPAMRDHTPDFLAVVDESSAEAFMTLHPEFNREHIVVAGNPAFDELSFITERRQQFREMLDSHSGQTLVTYGASSISQFDINESHDVLVPWLKKKGAQFIQKFHPADLNKNAAKVEEIRQKLREALGEQFVDDVVHETFSTVECAMASDLFVTDYSTSGVESTIMGIPTVFLMLKSAQEYQKSRGGQSPYFPILDNTYGIPPALCMTNPEQQYVLDLAFDLEMRSQMRTNMKEFFPTLCDGKASKRVLDLINYVATADGLGGLK